MVSTRTLLLKHYSRSQRHELGVFGYWAFCCHMWALHELLNIANFTKTILKMILKIISGMIWHFRRERIGYPIHNEDVGNPVAFGWTHLCCSVLPGAPFYMNGGSCASYLARTLCVLLFCPLCNGDGNRTALRPPRKGGDHFHCAVEPSPGHTRC